VARAKFKRFSSQRARRRRKKLTGMKGIDRDKNNYLKIPFIFFIPVNFFLIFSVFCGVLCGEKSLIKFFLPKPLSIR
jgi:hypothetical protein